MITIDNNKYISSDELMDKYPSFFKGCKTSRNIITKMNISKKNFIYCKLVDDEWVISSGKVINTINYF